MVVGAVEEAVGKRRQGGHRCVGKAAGSPQLRWTSRDGAVRSRCPSASEDRVDTQTMVCLHSEGYWK